MVTKAWRQEIQQFGIQSSRAEQAAEIKMTPALYRCTIQQCQQLILLIWITCQLPILSSATIQGWCHFYFSCLLSSTTLYTKFYCISCLCTFVTIPISPFFNSENFQFTCCSHQLCPNTPYFLTQHTYIVLLKRVVLSTVQSFVS